MERDHFSETLKVLNKVSDSMREHPNWSDSYDYMCLLNTILLVTRLQGYFVKRFDDERIREEGGI